MNTRLLSCALLVGGVTSCSGKADDTVASAERPTSSAAPSASSSAASMVVVPPPVPTLRPVPAHGKEKDVGESATLFTVRGAVLLATANRVGRLTESGIEWKGSLDVDMPGFGRGVIRWAGGRYPDEIDITFSLDNGRIPQPTYHALTGKGTSRTFSAGGGMGWVSGVARIGDTVMVSGYDMTDGQTNSVVRGPVITRLPVAWPLKCKGEPEGVKGYGGAIPPAIRPEAFGSSHAGTLFSIGKLCGKKPAAEVWPKDGGQPRIHELGELVKELDHGVEILQGSGDQVWVYVDDDEPILEWKGDQFMALPRHPRPVRKAFVSTEGKLHIADDSAIQRLEGDRFVEVARLVWPSDFESIAVEGGVFWATMGMKLHQLEKGDSTPAAEGCKTPFVHLYDVSGITEPKFTFPATRKALATFAPLEGVELVDHQAGRRRLGAVVPSWEVGEKLASHVRATMKDENPQVVCFEPKKPRKVAIADGK